ncbi:MAG: hypothetical protein ACRDF8_02115, partial [Chloroflexota bacterium]
LVVRAAIDAGSTWEVQAGIDVAGPGEDETSLYVVWGGKIVDGPYTWQGIDARGPVIKAMEPWRALIKRIKVDAIGQGFYFAQHLMDSTGGNYGNKVVMVNVGIPPRDREKFVNLKAELYWGLRMRVRAGDLAGLSDERTIGQLAGILYKENERGQVLIEPKEQAAKRGVPSPDRAESLMLALSDRGATDIDEIYWVVTCECGQKGMVPPWSRDSRCNSCGRLLIAPKLPDDEQPGDNPWLVLAKGIN